jgi:UDP-glucose 4-epimerase
MKGIENSSTELQIIRHSDIFRNSNSLPTFNSQAIETQLHNIPGLSEHFIYSNDDFFCGADLPRDFFFLEDGRPRNLLEGSHVAYGPKLKGMSMHAMAWINNNELLDGVLYPTADELENAPKRRYPSHVMQPLLKSTFMLAQENSLVKYCFERTALAKFRNPLDVYPIGFLIYWNLITGKAIGRDAESWAVFHDLEKGDDAEGLMRFLISNKPALFCINDGGYTLAQGRAVVRGLSIMFPYEAEWETGAIASRNKFK